MAPILWESLSFKISARLPGNPACLGSEDGGVLAHVRFVEIDGRKVNFTGHDRDSDNPIDVEVLQILLRALPRNRLLGIHFNVEIEVDAIRDVLYPQQELQTLEIEQYVSARKSPMQLILAKQGSWVKPALRNIRKLRIPISDEDSNKYENTIYILQNAPRLKRLSLKGAYDCSSLVDDSHKYDAFGGPYRKGEVFQTLQLDDL
jgi:hypothetical protein